MIQQLYSSLWIPAVCLGLLAPAARAQTWTRLANSPPSAVSACFLLTDGGVMCQSGFGWYKLTPDANGSYINGTWSKLASLPGTYGPEDYASAVLADGRLAILGGEYNLGSLAFSNMGAIYDPIADSWSMIPPPNTGGNFQCMGDVSSVVLPNGNLLIGSKFSTDLAVLNPATLKWSAVSETGKNGPSNAEEGWTLLPDGSIFTVNVAGAPGSQRLLLSGTNGTWVTAGNTPQDLHAPPSEGPIGAPGCPVYSPPGEMGPAVLRPDGTVFAVGASGFTGIYTPPTGGSTAPGNWAMGPSLPPNLNVEDGPAALLPNGHVLFGASPSEFFPGLQYFEFDGANLTSVPAPGDANSIATYYTQLLLLPTGQVLFVYDSLDVEVYTPLAAPIPVAWAPAITSAPASVDNGSTYQIAGTQFNGLSQGTSFGDELQNATNYPLVRITNKATGHVFYARTHGHSTMAVATGQTIVSTNFDVPPAIEAGDSTIQVVANGIASPGVDVMVSTPNPVPLSIATSSLPTGIAGVSYSATLNAAGGLAPFTWQLIAGNLPQGLTLDSQTGQLSGTPTTPGSTALTFQVTDSTTPTAQTATATLTLSIVLPLSITTTSLPHGSVSTPYSATLAATGGVAPYLWQLSSGSLPNGLTLNPQTGQIGGTPMAAANTQLTFLVMDASSPVPQTATVTLSLTVSVVPLVIISTSLPAGQINVPYSANLTAAGGVLPYTWKLISGTLPAGLSLTPQTGQIQGTPTTVVLNAPLTFQVTDSGTPTPQTATVTLSLSVTSAVLTILTASLPNAQVNVPYSANLTAAGGVSPFTWTYRRLPAGFSLDPQTGQLAGTAASTFSTTVSFTVTDSSSPPQSATSTLGFSAVLSGFTITTASLPPGQVNVPYSATLSASGGSPPYTWQLLSGALPNGIGFNATTGQISGVPTAPVSNASLTFQASDSSVPPQTATVSLILTVNASGGPTNLTITTVALPNGQLNVPYSAILTATGGMQPYTWSVRRLPAGLSLNPQTGQISGIPTDLASSLPLTFTVTDSSPITESASVTLALTIGAASTLSITTASLPAGQINVPYSAALTAAGGRQPYTWQLVSGSLPSGLSLNAATGQISGTAAAPVSNSPLTFQVTDSSSPALTATAAFTLTIAGSSALTITTTSLPPAQVGAPYSASLTAVGGTPPLNWSTRRMPDGLVLNPQTGQISGTPSLAAATGLIVFTVTDSSAPAQSASVTLLLVVNGGPE
jgi:hypothetical protein